MKAIILAGGFGTRLQGRVPNLPKPMAPIAGRPFLEYVLERLTSGGVRDIILSTGYRASDISSYFGATFHESTLRYVIETEPLGTGGAITYALRNEGAAPVLVLNGDTLLDIDLNNLIGWYNKEQPTVAMVLREVPDTSRYGSVITSGDLVTGFAEKGKSGSGLINAGMYIIHPEIFPAYEVPDKFSFEVDFLQRFCVSLKPRAYVCKDYFIDIGIPDDFERAQSELPNLKIKPV